MSRRDSTRDVDPRVLREARRLARGDLSRIRVVTPTEVVVRNPLPDSATTSRRGRATP